MRECEKGSVLHVYLSPEHAGKSMASLASWYVDDVEGVVDELTSKGAAFQHYDVAPIVTDEKGMTTFEGEPRSPTSRTRMATPIRSPRSRAPDRAQSPSIRSYTRASLWRSGTDNLKKPFPPLLREGAAEGKSAGGGKPSWIPVYASRF